MFKINKLVVILTLVQVGLFIGQGAMAMDVQDVEDYKVYVRTATITVPAKKKTVEQLLKRNIKKPEGSAEQPIEFPQIKGYYFGLLTSLLEKETDSDLHDFIMSLRPNDIEPLIALVKSFDLAILGRFLQGLQASGRLEKLEQAKNKLFIGNSSGGAIELQWAVQDEQGREHVMPPRVLDAGAPNIFIGPIGEIMYVKYAKYGKVRGLTSLLGWYVYSREDLNSQQMESTPQTDIIIHINSALKPIIEKTEQSQMEAAAVALGEGEYPANVFLKFFPRINTRLIDFMDEREHMRIPDMEAKDMNALFERELRNGQLKWHHFLDLPEGASAEYVNARYGELMAKLPENDDEWVELAKSYLRQARDTMLTKQTWGQWTGWSK